MIPTLIALLDLLLSFVAWLIVVVAMSQPRTSEAQQDRSPGSVAAEISWPNGDQDVDLWVQAPGEPPVGYSNKGSDHCNLLRDDLGHPDEDRNDEVTWCRGAPAGDYTVNVHAYRTTRPLNVHVAVRSVVGQVTIWQGDVDVAPREERTAVRFSLDASGHLVDGSVHHLPKLLVTAPIGGGPR